MVHRISVRIADVHDELKRVLTHLNEFPSPQAVEECDGPSRPSVQLFYSQLSATTRKAGEATGKVMTELAELDSAIRAALEDLTAHDADLALSAGKVESFLDSAAEHPASESPGPVEGKGGGSYLPGSDA